MKILCLTLDFSLPGCHSLKDKRRRVRKLRDRFGQIANIAVSESGLHDFPDRSQWSFVLAGQDPRLLEAEARKIEQYCHTGVEGYVTGSRLQQLL